MDSRQNDNKIILTKQETSTMYLPYIEGIRAQNTHIHRPCSLWNKCTVNKKKKNKIFFSLVLLYFIRTTNE